MISVFAPFLINIFGICSMLMLYTLRHAVFSKNTNGNKTSNIKLKQYILNQFNNIDKFINFEKLISVFILIILSLSVIFNSQSMIFMGGWNNQYGISLNFYFLFKLLYVSCVFVSIMYVIKRKTNKLNYYLNEYFFIFFILLCFYGILSTNDVFNLYVWLEILMFSSVAFIIKSHFFKINIALENVELNQVSDLASSVRDKIQSKTIMNYIIFNIVTGSLILVLIVLLYRFSGTLNINYIYQKYNKNIELTTCMLFFILAIKAGVLATSVFLSSIYNELLKFEKILFLSVITKINIFCIIKVLFYINPEYAFIIKFIKIFGFFAILRTLFNNNQWNMISINSSAMIFVLSSINLKLAIIYSINSIIINAVMMNGFFKNKIIKYICFVNLIPIPPFFAFFYKINIIASIHTGNIIYLLFIALHSVIFCYKIIPNFFKNNFNEYIEDKIVIESPLTKLSCENTYKNMCLENAIVIIALLLMMIMQFFLYYKF